MKNLLCAFFMLLISSYTTAEQSSCPHHSEHSKVDERSDQVMGFDHTKTTHHFNLKRDGGVIVAESKDANDTDSIEKIRDHFVEITGLFARGDFSKPKVIHDRVPPGVSEMIQYRNEISYIFHETPKGGEVRIQTTNPAALKAIHAFLRFQIEDHKTGDPQTIQ